MRRKNTDDIYAELINLLADFKKELASHDLRKKVQALIPAFKSLQSMGISLVPDGALAARERILYYFCKYPNTIVSSEELMVVGGISEWARRVRELRVQFGWAIISGMTAKEMGAQGDFSLSRTELARMGTDDYILISEEQDREAAHRWHLAREIKKSGGSSRDKILTYLKANVGIPVPGEELRDVSGDASEWARRVRELRTEQGWPVASQKSGRPDLRGGFYVLESTRQGPVHDRKIEDSIRSKVLLRDRYKCTKCGWSRNLWESSDPRHLEAHHVRPHVDGGRNDEDNLITLCSVCHDAIHAGKTS